MSALRILIDRPCPECGSTNVYASANDVAARVVCPDCGHSGEARRDANGGDGR